MSKFKDSEYFISGKCLENLKNASELSKCKNKELKKERILNYDKNPKKCTNCLNSIQYDKRNNKFCSSSCSATYNNLKRDTVSDETKKNISNALKGRKLSKEHIKNLTLSNINRFKNEDEKNIISESLKKYWKDNDFAKNNLSLKLTGRTISKETREKLSNKTSERIKNGTFEPELKSIRCFYKFKDIEIRCDSKVEYSCLNYFEENFNVINIERCDFLIDFIYDDNNKKYNPDFKITTTDNIYIVECKTILSSKNLVRKWQYYYDTIKNKKIALNDYCKKNGFLSFNYNKSMNIKFYNSCDPLKK